MSERLMLDTGLPEGSSQSASIALISAGFIQELSSRQVAGCAKVLSHAAGLEWSEHLGAKGLESVATLRQELRCSPASPVGRASDLGESLHAGSGSCSRGSRSRARSVVPVSSGEFVRRPLAERRLCKAFGLAVGSARIRSVRPPRTCC